MDIDHIFVFSPNRGAEVDELISFGFREGSGRTHPGVGTANRRIFFDGFYLEILWVENESEARATGELGVWERSRARQTGYSPFGLCLVNSQDTDALFEDGIRFQPAFLSGGALEIVTTAPGLPWIFRLPRHGRKGTSDEPRAHPVNVQRLTQARFEIRETDADGALATLTQHSLAQFETVTRDWLYLEFDHGAQGVRRVIESLHLELRY